MNPIYESTPADRKIFEEFLRDFLPDELFDLHSHLAPPGTITPPSAERLERYWSLRLPAIQSAEEYLAAYKNLLPGKRVTSVAFGMPIQESNVDAQNAYIMESARRHPQIKPFFMVQPDDEEERLEAAVEAGFLGFKPYPDFVQSDHPAEERIGEFLTPVMCRVANRHRLPVILHISRSRRFADPENIRDLIELTDRWPDLRLIVAHLGRSYNPYYLEEGLKQLAGRCAWWYDFAAVANPEVLRLALQAIPHERICFGLDNPLMLARGYYDFPAPDRYAVHIHGYNLESADHPPLAYQILLAFRQAALETGISRDSVRKILYQNAFDLVNGRQVS